MAVDGQILMLPQYHTIDLLYPLCYMLIGMHQINPVAPP